MPRPNLLFLFTDEQRADTLAAYGNRRIHMPNLDRLAGQATVFERAYVSQPVCTPSRSTILTGLWPHTNGCVANNVPLPADLPALPEMLPPGAWTCGYHGKWHLGDEIFCQHGFDDWVSVEDMYRQHYSPGRDRAARSDYHHWLAAAGTAPADGSLFGRTETARLDESLSKPAFLAETACRFIHENRRRPWALFVNFLEPHMPFFGPRDAQYAPDDVTLPDNFDAAPAEDQPLKTRLFARHYARVGASGLPLRTEADWRRLIANYWGLCSLVDTHVGTILSAVADAGLWDNTIVVYTSDHGDMMGSHRLVAKCVMFEEAVRVPLLLRLPGQSAGRRLPAPVSQIDLAPTVLDLMGTPLPGHLQGRSLRGALESPAPPADCGDVFVEWNGDNSAVGPIRNGPYGDDLAELATHAAARAAVADPVRTVVTGDGWKFNCSPAGEHELYHLPDDPGETVNLAARPEQRARMADLAGRIRAWQQRTGDEVQLPEIMP